MPRVRDDCLYPKSVASDVAEKLMGVGRGHNSPIDKSSIKVCFFFNGERFGRCLVEKLIK